MKALQELWRDNPYTVAAAVIAPIVFGLVFAVAWVLSNSNGGDAPPVVAQVEQTQPNTPAAAPAQSGAAQSTPAAQAQSGQSVSASPVASSPQAADSDQPAPSPEQQSSVSAANPQDQPSEPEPPPLDEVLPEPLNDEMFRYGLEEERGAILPIDNGIVPSSGPRHSTSWELLVPTARIRADIVSLGRTPSGALGAPDNPFVVGWFDLSAKPGEAGNTILGGHRDYEDIDGNIGVGVCWELDQVRIGDQMVIRDAEQNIAWVYQVTESTVVDPDDPASLRYLTYSDEPIITLITCTGSFNPKTHLYSHRLIVVATLQATAST